MTTATATTETETLGGWHQHEPGDGPTEGHWHLDLNDVKHAHTKDEDEIWGPPFEGASPWA